MSQYNSTITKIVMNSDFNCEFYNQYDLLVVELDHTIKVSILGTYLICSDDNNSVKFFVNTVTLISGPTFSQAYTPLSVGFYQQDSAYFNRLNEIKTYIETNVVKVLYRGINALFFGDGTVQKTAGGSVSSVGFVEGTGIDITGTNPITTTGSVTITNTAPDQVVVLNEGTGIDVTGTYPNFTITNTAPHVPTEWGDITGLLSDQTDLQNALDDKVPYTGATTDVDLGVYKLSADAVEFSLTPTNLPAAGQIAYDGATGALAYLMNSSNVICYIGQQLFAYVKNAESVTITKGQPVYLYQASGNKATVKLAYNTSDAGSAKTIGLAAEDITANHNGFIICQGVLSGVNTGSYNEGDTLYLGATAGTLTATKPYAPNHLVYIGVVEKANNGAGQIYVKIQNGYEMDELHNVDAYNPNNNDGLFYNTSTSLWEHKSIATVLGYTPQEQLTLTTTGSSGAATLVGSTLNIPQYSGSGSSTSIQIITGSTTALAAGTTRYGTVAGTTSEAQVSIPLASACTMNNLYVRTTATMPVNSSLQVTLVKNGTTATSVTVTIAAGSAAGIYSDTTNNATYSAGDRYQIEFKNTGSATAAPTSGQSFKITI
jgi:hypothetical protein